MRGGYPDIYAVVPRRKGDLIMNDNYKSDLQMIGLIEVMQIKLMTLGDMIRTGAEAQPVYNAITEICGDLERIKKSITKEGGL